MARQNDPCFLAEVTRLHERGWAVIPLALKTKSPGRTGWQRERHAREELNAAFAEVCNVGVLLGDPSGGLVDVDLDSPEAIQLADVFLPPTAVRFGRGQTPESHRLYVVGEPVATKKFQDPTQGAADARTMLVELRSTGCQTLIPPSLHPSGELITWAERDEPAKINRNDLVAAVSRLAAAALLARHWPTEGGRHDAAMALCGGLLRAGWDREETGRFLSAIARAAGDDEVKDRIRAVTSTADALDAGHRATGWPKLKELIDARVVDAVTTWLDISPNITSSSDSYESNEVNDGSGRRGEEVERRARAIPVPSFPLVVFPPLIQQYIEDGADTVGCPPDLIAVPFLGYAAAANGRQRRLSLKRRWTRKSTLWTGVVAVSGSGKSPADGYARAPLDVLQGEADERYHHELTAYQQDLARWKANGAATRGDEPVPPVYEHWFTTDPTVESLAPMLMTNSGIAAAFDELVSWARGCNSYKKGGNDRQKYLELWNGRSLKIDRKSQQVIYVKDPVCCLVGGIQPERLPEMAREASVHDGLVPRFLWTYPDVPSSGWRWDERDSDDLDKIILLFRMLRKRPPATLTIHAAARGRWEAWYNENQRECAALPPLAREMASKLPAHLATLWLVLHCLWDPEGRESQVHLAQLDGAITLVEYFRSHARRVMTHFGTDAPHVDAGVAGRVAAILRNADGPLSKTELSNALHRNVKADELDAALTALLADGVAEARQEGEGVRARSLWRWVGVEDDLDGGWDDDDPFTLYEATNQSGDERESAETQSIGSFDSYESTTLPIAEMPQRPRTCFSCGGTFFRVDGVCLTCHPDPTVTKEDIA